MADMNRFMITHWCGVPHKFIRHEDGTLAVERFEEMKEAGINLVECYDYGYETQCEALTACERLGLRVTIRDDRIAKAADKTLTREERREILASMVRDYSGYPALLGYHIVDEPNSRAFPVLAEIREILSELDPAHESYFNLYPNYASPEMLGNPTYYDHLDDFVERVKPEILSYDHYHFYKGAPIEQGTFEDERQNQILAAAYRKESRPGFFDNIEDAMAVSLKTGVPFMVIILLTEHEPYRNLTEEEIRWEVYQTLCYGVKRLSYFTYWTPGVDTEEGDSVWHWQNGMINKDGTRNPHYYMVARINRELQAVGDILLSHTVQAVFHIGDEPDGKVRYWQGSYGDVTGLNATRMTAGFFDGGYVLLASKDFEEAQDVRLAVLDGRTVTRFDKESGIWKPLAPTDGTYTVTLAAGDGELLRIV